jgi:hypothetical protein
VEEQLGAVAQRSELVEGREPVAEVLVEVAVPPARDRLVPRGELPLGLDVRRRAEGSRQDHPPPRHALELGDVRRPLDPGQVLEDVDAADRVERPLGEGELRSGQQHVGGLLHVRRHHLGAGEEAAEEPTAADVEQRRRRADQPGRERMPLPGVGSDQETGCPAEIHSARVPAGVRFLFVTIQGFESEFYGRVARKLTDSGHDISHVAYSPRSARVEGLGASLRERMQALRVGDLESEARRIERQYQLPTLRSVYVTDPACEGRSEAWCTAWTVRQWLALESVFEDVQPDCFVSEVGCETVRTAAQLVSRGRGVPTLYFLYTIFPRPLRIYVDEPYGPIVPTDDLRPLSAEEREEYERFRREFTARAEPIRERRQPRVTRRRLRRLGMYVRARFGVDRGNEYLRPGRWLADFLREPVRRAAARAFYRRPAPDRPFVYFPLHVAEDFKIKRLLPQYADQAAVVEQVADALPHGYDLVLKEHPVSVGRNSLGSLRRLTRRPNVRLAPASTSSHHLVQAAEAVTVIGSTTGFEALLYEKPVLTLGRPFYAGYGVTLDLDSPAGLEEALPELLAFAPDPERIARLMHAAMRRCLAGAPVLVDPSDDNARDLAASIESGAAEFTGPRRAPQAGSGATLSLSEQGVRLAG